jgi:hypothetical protein
MAEAFNRSQYGGCNHGSDVPECRAAWVRPFVIDQGPEPGSSHQRWCQSNANQSPNLQMMRISRRQLTPFGQRGGAIFFEGFAAVEMTFEIEVIVDRSMN